MPSPDHRKQRQYNNLEIMDPPSTTLPLAIDFGNYKEDIDMDTGGNENNGVSSVNSMSSDGTMTVVEELSITDNNFNNDMDYTTSPRPTIMTATNQSNGGYTPVLNRSPNR
jgi:hypothetical protein